MSAPFASAAAVRREVARLARPPERIRVSEGAKRYLRLRTDGGGSEEWNADLTPYLTEPLDRLADRRYEAVVFIGPARTGKTGALLGFVAYIIKCDPSDAMILHMSQDKAGKFSKKELRRMYLDSPALRRELTGRAQDDNVFEKTHRAGNVLYIGWPSATQLSGETLKYMALTDYDRMPLSIEGEGGSPFLMAKMRTTTFLSRGSTFVETSPGFEVTDPAWTPEHPHQAPPTFGGLALYNQGTQCRRYLPCPHCGEYFMEPDRIDGFSFTHDRDANGITRPDAMGRVYLTCGANGCRIEPEHKRAMSRAGLWVPRGCRIQDGQVVGEPRDVPYATYWLTGVSAAYQEWRQVVRAYLDAEHAFDTTGDEVPLRDAYTLKMGAPFLSRARQATRDSQFLTSRREEDLARGVVPQGVRFLLATVDVQGGRDRRFVVQVVGYGIHLESWLIDRFSLRYLDEEQTQRLDMSTTVEHWDVLIEHAIERSYPLADGSGRRLPVHLTVCDSGGEDGVTDRAYAFYRSLRPKGLSHRFMLIKGESRKGAPKIEERFPDTAKRADRKADSRGDVPVWFLNANHLKDIVNNNLGRPDPGPGYMHLPTWIGRWFLDELTAERRGDDGTWEQVGAHNEAFDLYVYGQAGCIKLKADRMDWERPRPWALPWDENPEVLAEDGERGTQDPEPLPVGRRVRFRQRR